MARARLSPAPVPTLDAQYGCTASVRTGIGDKPWRYLAGMVKFPRAETRSDGGTATYRFSGYGKASELVSMVVCTVPRTEAALHRMDVSLHAHRAGGTRAVVSRGSRTVTGPRLDTTCDANGCTDDGIVATACEYGGTYPDCNAAAAQCSALHPYCGAGGATWGDFSFGGDGEWTQYGAGTVPADGTAYSQGFAAWGICILAVAGSGVAFDQVANDFKSWYEAYQDEQTAALIYQSAQQQYPYGGDIAFAKYRYDQAVQRENDMRLTVSTNAKLSLITLGAAIVACSPTLLIPEP